jgi:hypothetical protein
VLLEKMILDELQKFDLNGVYVLNVSLQPPLIRLTIEIGKAVVDFNVDVEYQYQILSINYDGVNYNNKDYLDKYNDWVTKVIVNIMPVVTNKIFEYETSPQGIEQRENEAKIREEMLDKKAFQLTAREQVLDFQEQALEFESQIFEDEKTLAEKQKLRAWMSENNHIIKRFGPALVIVIVLVFIFSRIASNEDVCAGSVIDNSDVNLQGGPSDAEIVADLRENFGLSTNAESYVRDNSSAVHVILGNGEFVVGDAIAPGRYTITASGFGNLVINSGIEQVINEMLGSGDHGVPSVTVSLKRGDVVEISGVEHVEFTPTIDQLLTTLTTGIWVVGIDIEAGTFDVTTENSTGNLIIRSPLGRVHTNAIISDQGFGMETMSVTLEDGDTIMIISLKHVNFE